MLNKVKVGGQMYQFLNDNGNKGYTWNVIKGKCPHDCSYCYMKTYPQPELHFDDSELKTNLGQGNFIFVGSSCDVWADSIPSDWIAQILMHCRVIDNKYLFQTKNPERWLTWRQDLFGFPSKSIFGTTIETNRPYIVSRAPGTMQRMEAMKHIVAPKMLSIEPIMDFDLDVLVQWVKEIAPEFVSIGADSKGHNLPEPTGDKVKHLISELMEITTVKTKANLNRLLTIKE